MGLALHRAKSKSSEHLHPGSEPKKLDKCVLSNSSRDLTSGIIGYDNVLAELGQKPKFRKSQEEIQSPAEPAEESQVKKRYTADTIPFSVKYSVSKDTSPATKLTMSVAVTSTNTQSQGNRTNGGDPDMDRVLSNIRMKLVSCINGTRV